MTATTVGVQRSTSILWNQEWTHSTIAGTMPDSISDLGSKSLVPVIELEVLSGLVYLKGPVA